MQLVCEPWRPLPSAGGSGAPSRHRAQNTQQNTGHLSCPPQGHEYPLPELIPSQTPTLAQEGFSVLFFKKSVGSGKISATQNTTLPAKNDDLKPNQPGSYYSAVLKGLWQPMF